MAFISRVWPSRLAGIAATFCLPSSDANSLRVISVSTRPIDIALQFMPSAEYILAIDLVKLSKPAFAAA